MAEFSKLTWLREMRPIIRTLTTTQRDVLDVVFDHANPDGTNAYRSQAQIAEAIGKRERQVRNVLGQLRELGLIVRTERGNRRLGKADVYALGSPAISDYRQSKVAGDDAAGITGTPGLPVKPGPEADYRQSADALPAILETITGNPGLPPNRPFTPDPGPIDPEMVREEEDDPDRESDTRRNSPRVLVAGDSETDPFVSVSSFGDSISSVDSISSRSDAHRRIADPFASLPSDSSAQGASREYLGGEHETSGAGSDDPETGEPKYVPSEQDQERAKDLGERLSKWPAPESNSYVVPWPAGKPIPKHGEPGFDPFADYVDEATGEPIRA